MRLLRKMMAGRGESFRIRHAGKAFTIPRRAGQDYILNKMELTGAFYEVALLDALAQVVRKGQGIALDCGANIGNHTLYFARVMGLKVHAFEPVTQNAAQLERLIALNSLDDAVRVVRSAVGDAAGRVQLALCDPSNPGMYAVSAQEGGISAPVTTLDAYLDETGLAADQITLLKVDVEGYETAVLRGAAGLLAAGAPVLSLELAGRAVFEEACDMVAAHGYHPAATHCHTPTVIFRKMPADAAARAQIERVQDAFDARGAAT